LNSRPASLNIFFRLRLRIRSALFLGIRGLVRMGRRFRRGGAADELPILWGMQLSVHPVEGRIDFLKDVQPLRAPSYTKENLFER
jgi:hypothetical protein